tara:strand:+ start:4549 stop:5382 length:834 start_codon:yes stop_codon:yes gene_type:complete
MRRTNYLNNKDILKEIHKSKGSFCEFTEPEYADYDLIYRNPIEKITKKAVKEARQNRAERLTQKKCDELGIKKAKIGDDEVRLRDIKDTDVIIRVYTYDHIPDDPDRKTNPKTVADTKVKLNFIPFKHYKMKDDGTWDLIGMSHWQGGFQNGKFSMTHGKITNKLAMMYMKLCQRYGSRGNWRGYTYNDEMQSQALLQLSQIGLQFDEDKSANPFAYYTAAITNSFTRILNVEKKHQSLRDDLLQEAGVNPSYTRQIEHEMKVNQEFGPTVDNYKKK